MRITCYHVGAFTNRLLGGNPAGVCPVNDWIPAETTQNTASEFNLSERACFVPRQDHPEIRRSTSVIETDPAGHPTSATAYALRQIGGPTRTSVRFHADGASYARTPYRNASWR